MAALDPLMLGVEKARRMLDGRLAAILDGGFEEIGECLILSRFSDSAQRTSVEKLGDATAFEAFVNHLHVEDSLDESAPESKTWDQTMAYATCLGHELADGYPGQAFEIIVSVGESHTVRFHKIRLEQPRWLTDDIDGYADEAVMSLVVSTES